MAEMILSMLLAFATGLHTLIRARPDDIRAKDQVLRRKFELDGQTLCVLGLGDIGGALARKAKALGMRVLGVRRTQAPFAGVEYPVAPVIHVYRIELDAGDLHNLPFPCQVLAYALSSSSASRAKYTLAPP